MTTTQAQEIGIATAEAIKKQQGKDALKALAFLFGVPALFAFWVVYF